MSGVIISFSTISPSFLYFKWKTRHFQIDLYTQERQFSWHTYKQPARIMKKDFRLSIFLAEFLIFPQSQTSVEADIQRNKREGKRIRNRIWGYFQGFRHSVSTTTVFTAMTTIFVAVNCRVHYVWILTLWRWRRSSLVFSAQLMDKISLKLTFPFWKQSYGEHLTEVSQAVFKMFFTIRDCINYLSYAW